MARRMSSPGPLMTGFTLIELMVALVVVTVLIMIAIPAYQNQIRESRRTEAKTALLDLAGREETLYSTQNLYSMVPSQIGLGREPFRFLSATTITPSTCRCQDPADCRTASSFLVTATPVAGSSQAQDAPSRSFSVDQLGNQTALDGGGAVNTTTCWGS